MKICPTTFGPYFWSVIHMTALSANEVLSDDKKEAYVRFFESMPDVLPCSMCGKHLKENLKLLPIDTEDMFRWSVDLHNLVNSQLHKPEIPYEQAYRYWTARCSRGPRKSNTLLVCITVLMFLAIVYLLMRS